MWRICIFISDRISGSVGVKGRVTVGRGDVGEWDEWREREGRGGRKGWREAGRIGSDLDLFGAGSPVAITSSTQQKINIRRVGRDKVRKEEGRGIRNDYVIIYRGKSSKFLLHALGTNMAYKRPKKMEREKKKKWKRGRNGGTWKERFLCCQSKTKGIERRGHKEKKRERKRWGEKGGKERREGMKEGSVEEGKVVCINL
jgi:hypothetical protein